MDAIVIRCDLWTVPRAEMTDVRFLEGLLDLLMHKDIEALQLGLAPTFEAAPGVRWADGGDVLDLPWAPLIVREGKAACGPLSAWCAASYRFTGQDPGARPAVIYRRAGLDSRPMHAVVRLSNGVTFDPSRVRGMKG